MAAWRIASVLALGCGVAACERAPEPARADAAASTASAAASTASATATPSSAPSASAPSATPSAATSDRSCDLARTALAELVSTFPTKCVRDADCDGYYVGASACDPPVVLAKPGAPPSQTERLEELQRAARASCLPAPAACAPRPFRARCRVGRCDDAARR